MCIPSYTWGIGTTQITLFFLFFPQDLTAGPGVPIAETDLSSSTAVIAKDGTDAPESDAASVAAVATQTTSYPAIVGSIDMPAGVWCSEAVFVPRIPEPKTAVGSNTETAQQATRRLSLRERLFGVAQDSTTVEHPTISSGEDDGYLLTFVLDEAKPTTSEVRIYSARTMSAVPEATIAIPARVPVGFHALFMSEADLAEHAAATRSVKQAVADAGIATSAADIAEANETITDAVFV